MVSQLLIMAAKLLKPESVRTSKFPHDCTKPFRVAFPFSIKMQTAPILNTWVRCTSGNVFNLPIIIPIMCSHVLHHNHHDDHHQHHHHHDRHDHRRSCSASPTPCHPSWQLRRRATLRWFKKNPNTNNSTSRAPPLTSPTPTLSCRRSPRTPWSPSWASCSSFPSSTSSLSSSTSCAAPW